MNTIGIYRWLLAIFYSIILYYMHIYCSLFVYCSNYRHLHSSIQAAYSNKIYYTTMYNKITNLAITGVNGRMGRQLVLASSKPNLINKCLAIVNNSFNPYKINIYKLNNIKSLEVITTKNIKASKLKANVLIDFTNPESSIYYLNTCCLNKTNIVVGTTGFNSYQHLLINRITKFIGIVYSANFSIGIALLLKLLRKVVLFLRESIDIQVVEVHHKNKRDTPSGTAIMIKNYIEDIYKSPIRISSMRIGNIIGEHKVIFTDLNECLSISHKAYSRIVFANGAIKASSWLLTKPKGLYNMITTLT